MHHCHAVSQVSSYPSIIIEHDILQHVHKLCKQIKKLTLTCIKHLSEGAALLTGDASDAEEELPAVKGVRVLGEGSGGSVKGTRELLSLVDGDGLEAALGDLRDPEATVGLTAVRQPGGTLVSDQIQD